MAGLELIQEAGRQLTVCNACRYCEGYCPVFPAIEIRRDFQQGDVFYLAHLCHDCRACYYACMYTPPHEFAINLPQILSNVRMATYRRWSWPAILSGCFAGGRPGFSLAGLVVALVLVVGVVFVPPGKLFALHLGPGAFYEVIPYLAMLIPAVVLFVYAIGVWLAGGARFWTETGDVLRPRGSLKALTAGLADAFGLPYLKGGGPGCFYPGERPSMVRRVYHALTFWGFLAAFVSTTLASFYQELLDRLPPYELTSAPVLFGSAGGVALLIGTGGLIWFKLRSDSAPAGAGASGLDYAFLFTLALTALTGMLTLIFRATAGMGSLLIIHLGFVAALFLTAPYGKFVHFVYRTLAMIRNGIERTPSR
jgi:citrate/tricarballylate utilization protein